MVFRRAVRDTFAKRFGQLFSAAVAGLFGWLYLYFAHGEDFAVAEMPFIIGAIVGTVTFVSVLFLWNLACAPYRIMKDQRDDLSSKLGDQEGQMSLQEFWSSRDYFTVKEVSCLLAGVPISNGEILGIASGHLYDICKRIFEGELKPRGLTKIQAHSLDMSRTFMKLDGGNQSPEWLESCEISKDQAIALGVKVEVQPHLLTKEIEAKTPR